MALIKCKECGHEVSDKASVCPNCGCPIEKRIYCFECGQLIPEGVNVCPNCGRPTQDNLTRDSESPKKSKSGLIWFISILALSVLLGGGYYFYTNSDMLIGEGIDYAHSGDKAERNLTKVEFAKNKAIEQKHINEERETITDNGSNDMSEKPNEKGYTEYIGKFCINGPDGIRQIITLREDKSVLLEVHYDFSNSDDKYLGVWRPYHSHYGDMICIDFTSKASLHIGRGWNPKQTTYYIYDMKIAMNSHDIPAHDEDAYSTITRM